MNPGLSYHSPLVMTCNTQLGSGSRPFKFFNYMGDHPNFLSVVQKGWDTNYHGSLMFRLWNKLKAVKQGLKGLHHQDFSKLEERIKLLREDLVRVQTQLASTPSCLTLQLSVKEHSGKLKKFLHIQESAFRQKSKIVASWGFQYQIFL